MSAFRSTNVSDKRKAKIVGPNDGEYYSVVGDVYRFIAYAGDTDGTYGFWEATVPPGGGPPPHTHSREEEGFYVIDGEVTIYVDGDEFVAGPGSFVNLPKGSKHRFRNNSDRPIKMLIIVAPGGFEGFFSEVGTKVAGMEAQPAANVEEQIARIGAIAPNYGLELLA